MSRSREIRETAVRLFYQWGYNGTSLKDIAKAMNLRAPSLYNHIESKQKLLQEIMFDGVESLASEFREAISTTDDVVERVRLGTEAHIRHHMRSRVEAHVNTYEIPSLEEPARTELLERRRAYARRWEALVQSGVDEGVFVTSQPKIVAFAIIDLGAGVARWYRPGGELSEDAFVAYYGQLALRMVGAAVAEEPQLPASALPDHPLTHF